MIQIINKMKTTTADMYYLKALNHYDYDLDTVVEYLNYALSYDEEHTQSLCLMGQVYMYDLKNYDIAAFYYTAALQVDIKYVEVYDHFILLKIWLGEYVSAIKFITFAKTVKGVNMCKMLIFQGRIQEAKGNYKEALLSLDLAFSSCFDKEDMASISCQRNRIKAKRKLNKKKTTIAKLKMV